MDASRIERVNLIVGYIGIFFAGVSVGSAFILILGG